MSWNLRLRLRLIKKKQKAWKLHSQITEPLLDDVTVKLAKFQLKSVTIITKTMTLLQRKAQRVWSLINYASLYLSGGPTALRVRRGGQGAAAGVLSPRCQFAPFSRTGTTALGYSLLQTVYWTHLAFHRTSVTCFFKFRMFLVTSWSDFGDLWPFWTVEQRTLTTPVLYDSLLPYKYDVALFWLPLTSLFMHCIYYKFTLCCIHFAFLLSKL